MKKIALISQKGGTGKTTLAINLAVEAGERGLVTAIFDLDPQGSSLVWYKKRKMQGLDTPLVKSLHAVSIDETLEKAEQAGADLIIFDTAPHSQNEALITAKHSDLILIPCKPSLVDLKAISSSVDIVSLANKPAVGVLTMTPSQSSITEQARKAIEQYNIKIAPINIGNRIAFVHAFTEAQGVVEYDPHGQASTEIKELFKFIQEQTY